MPSTSTTYATQPAYAKKVGLSQRRIAELIREGLPVNGSRVDVAKADAWLALHIDPARREAALRGRAERVSGGSVAGARQQKLETDVQLSRLKLGERSGALVERAAVDRFIFERARFERDRWVGWIARTAPTLAHELDCDPAAAFAVLDRLVREHLTELSKAPLEAVE